MNGEPAKREIRVGIAGAGIIAGIHLPNLRQCRGVRVAAICDVDEARARTLAGDGGALVYVDAQRMLDEADLDALVVCLPPFARGDLVEQAVRRGLHVYVEKPLALDLEGALRTADAVEASGVIASVGYMWRYAPVVERAKSVIEPAGSALLLGRMLNGPPGPAWALDRNLSGGLIVEFATHMADLLRYLGGEITHVSGVGSEVAPGPATRGPDSAVLALRFANGTAGSLETSWAFPGAIWDVQVIVPGGHLQLSLNPERLHGQFHGEDIAMASETPGGGQPHGFSGGPSWFLAIQAFVEAVRLRDPSLVRSPYRDGVRTLTLTLAADEALRTRQTVAVANV